ncbi:MAG: beta-ketoacyl-ACP synthase II [Candidatus Cloacimonetes bacterium]|nr:beta-ketoacyl-ACP synthase II [Candidatus Cloacimonadota bacterium]
MKRRIVVTGLGAINAIGHNVAETWESLVNGKSGIALITRFDPTEFNSKIAAEIKNYDPLEYFEKKQIKKIDPYTQFCIIAAREAMTDAAFDSFDPERFGVILGSGIGGMLTFENEVRKLVEKGPRRISPFFIPKMITNIAAAHLSIEHNLKGVNFNTVTACASANHAIGSALRAIQYGDADIILTGGCEAAVTPMAVGGFCAMKALSTNNDDPVRSSRPFDAMRDGFVMGEGAGVLVFEELEHARARGARIYCEVAGFGATADAYHITAPVESGEGGARAMNMALKDAGVEPAEVNYINAHGTSTPLNDKTETASIKTVFGEYAHSVLISSTKSMTGHTLGAAAAIEAIACIKAIQTGVVHPTINYEHPDPECDLNYVPNKAIEKTVRTAISNSLGFGGHNAVVCLRAFE